MPNLFTQTGNICALLELKIIIRFVRSALSKYLGAGDSSTHGTRAKVSISRVPPTLDMVRSTDGLQAKTNLLIINIVIIMGPAARVALASMAYETTALLLELHRR